MKKAVSSQTADDEMRAEYDFSGGVRGKYAAAMKQGHTVRVIKEDGTLEVTHYGPAGSVTLEPDVREYFPTSEAVNHTLRMLIKLVNGQEPTSQKGEKETRVKRTPKTRSRAKRA